MSKVYIPQDYHTPLSVYEMQRAIEFIKSNFQVNLSNALNLRRVSAPLFVDENSGLNDNLNGVERPVSFDIPDVGTNAQVVHSLAKWKRLALKRYDFKVGKGLFTDMNAIRRDEEVDNLHSVYVDQWDWEKVISAEDRNVAYLKRTVRDIVSAVSETSSALNVAFPSLHTKLPSEVFFITTQELEDLYPDLTPKQREDEICKKKGVVFLMQIGKILKSGIKHDGRAPDYDDWELNGDILYWNEVLGHAFEISSMGIRVDPKSLDSQLTIAGCDDRRALPFHKMLLNGELPLTMGGGIGQSRLCMLLIGTAHIGEVQVSLWDEATRKTCRLLCYIEKKRKKNGDKLKYALQQHDARILAGLARGFVPQGDLYLADVRGADEQHAQAALADAAAHGQGQLAIQQHLVEGERAAVVAAGDRQLGVEGLGVDADTHGRDLERMAEHFVPVEDIAVELPIVIVGGAAVVLDAGL